MDSLEKKSNLKIGVIGGVKATGIILEGLQKFEYKNVHVWSYLPKNKNNTSSWIDIEEIALSMRFKCQTFQKVTNCQESIKSFKPDLVFVVGLSQLIPLDIINIPKYGCIGFHPTCLPLGRGRAPIPWLIINQDKEQSGAATFFYLTEGTDDGPIIAQEYFDINESDYAEDVEKKMLQCEFKALEDILSDPKFPRINGITQNEKNASYYGVRTPSDGIISWDKPRSEIIKLIKAVSSPFPGAYTFNNENKIIISKASLSNDRIKGVIGKILRVFDDNKFLIQCGDSIICIEEWSCDNCRWVPRVGLLLGYKLEDEIFHLKQTVSVLNAKIDEINNTLKNLKDN